MNKLPKAILALFASTLVSCHLLASVGRIDYVPVDLAKRTATVSWTWTELADTAVRLALSRNGEDFDTADWGGSLFIGDGNMGVAIGGVTNGYNELLFDVDKGSIPTNGTYAVQIIATNTAGRVEEWARGKLVVRANPAAEGMPSSWNAYAELADRVLPYVLDAIPALLPEVYTNVAEDVFFANVTNSVTNMVTKTYVESLGISGGSGGTDGAAVTNIAAGVTSNVVTKTYVENLGISTGLSTNDVQAIVTNEVTVNYSAWTIYREGTNVTSQVHQPYYDDDGDEYGFVAWIIAESLVYGDTMGGAGANVTEGSGADATGLAWTDDTWIGLDHYEHNYTATRQRTTRNALGLARLVDLPPLTNGIPEAIASNATTITTQASRINSQASRLTTVESSVASVSSTVNSWEGYWDGTNVIFEVTNYYGNTSGELPRLRIKEYRDDAWNVVWDEANKFAICESNIVDTVAASNTALKTELATKFAPLAWGTVTDKGTSNVVGNSVWMTSPETYFAGGTEYQRVAVGAGAVCVLVDNGAGTYTTGEAGTFRFQDEGGTNYFGFAKSDSYTVGCDTDGITVDGTLVTLRYNVIMSGTDVPIIYWRESLTSGSWTQLNNTDGTATADAPYTVTWVQDTYYYANINCGANASGFFKAETAVAGDVVFETNMKARLDGGIVCTNTATGVMGVIRPTYNGSSVSWVWSAR